MPYFPPTTGQITNTVTNTVATNKKVNAQTGTSYTLVASDTSGLVTLDNSSPITVMIPSNKSLALPIGTVVELLQLGTGQVTVSGFDITISSKNDQKQLKGQYSQATLIKTDADAWVLTGDLVDPNLPNS